ncbi:flotillin family protein [Anaeromyxobacter oryzae]|uniref:hypothetical protein n=1 Tax=Anaeromyxobacter oryzae TaxID=2918170 RepID=UPI0020C18182|nr:hypothetical protein [Anaeromyxobacter oryzae]
MIDILLSFSVIASVVGVALFAVLFWLSNTVRYIPNNRVGVIERLWSFRGSLDHGFIALEGEAGFQPEVLRGGWHVFPPFQYRVHVVPLVTIPQGKIGYVFARDGETLPPTQTLASNARAADFTDAAAFLRSGGRSAGSCARAPTRSTSPSSSSSPPTASRSSRSPRKRPGSSAAWPSSSTTGTASSRSSSPTTPWGS